MSYWNSTSLKPLGEDAQQGTLLGLLVGLLRAPVLQLQVLQLNVLLIVLVGGVEQHQLQHYVVRNLHLYRLLLRTLRLPPLHVRVVLLALACVVFVELVHHRSNIYLKGLR